MARSIQTIYDSLIQYKETAAADLNLTPVGNANYSNTLSELNSNSRVARWRLLLFIQAVATWMLEKIFDAHKAEVEDLISQGIAGTTPWLVGKTKEFQFNTNSQLIVDDSGVPKYDVINLSQRIVSFASAKDINSEVLLKVAKTVANNKVALTTQELSSLRAYVNRIKPAGLGVNIQSLNGDLLRLRAKVYFNGLYTEADVLSDVIASLNNYLNNLDFDGSLYVEALIDSIQKVAGVKDVVLEYLVGVNGNSVTTIVDLQAGIYNRLYATRAGYISLDSNPANINIQLIAE